MSTTPLRGATHHRNIFDVRKAMHSRSFDSASQVLAICQGNPILSSVAHSAAKRMLFHLRELHELVIAEMEYEIARRKEMKGVELKFDE